MHILMVGMSSYPGGIENFIANYFLTEKFVQHNSIDFITYEQTIAYEERIIDLGYAVKRVPHLRKHPMRYAKALRVLLKQNKYDCVYVNMLSAANMLPLRYAAKARVPKVVAHAHANSTVKALPRRLLHKLNKNKCNKYANIKLACSAGAGRWLFNGEFSIVPNAIDMGRFAFNEKNRAEIRAFWRLPENAFVLGQVGRLAEEKNHSFTLEVFKQLLFLNENAYLMIVGDGMLRSSLQEKAKSLGIDSKVVFAGTTNETEKYYSAFDSFIFPSIFEGFGMVALEAQACGLPCYCSNSLSAELKVSSNIQFLPLEQGAEFWAQKIMQEANKENRREANLQGTEFDINKQIEKLMDILK